MRPDGRVAAGGRSPLRPFGPRRQTGRLGVTKAELRDSLRKERKAHVAALPESIRGLLFRQPPGPLLRLIPAGATIGLYRATPAEAPASRYAAHFLEAGHRIALPRFGDRADAMTFANWSDPFGDSDLEPGPFGLLQPALDALHAYPASMNMGTLVGAPKVRAAQLLRGAERGATIGILACDSGLKYLSTELYG